jgi:hypothetical protein
MMRSLCFLRVAVALFVSCATVFAPIRATPAQILSGMICENGNSVCRPGGNGEGAAVAFPIAVAVASASNCYTASGEDRAAILNVLRTPVAADLKIAVEFVVERARICGDWAFVIATPQPKGGGAMRWTGTVCAGDTSHLAGGLMRRNGATWRLVEYALCPSDVAWSDWPEKFNAPQALFDQ